MAATLSLLCALLLAVELYEATDFPTASPITVVDAALVARLRAAPGLHLALAPDARFDVTLDLVDDAQNRRIYGTSVDMRERVARRAIHVQRIGERGAIHTDLYNPRMDAWSAFLHGTLEVPVIPLGAGIVVFAIVAMWRRPQQAMTAIARSAPR